MKFQYRKIRLSPENQSQLRMINDIIKQYQAEGYKLTLRQLYYQLVSRDIIPNQSKEYDKLSILLREGRMGGIVDWDAIEDRLRVPKTPASFESPEAILMAAADQFALPRMKGQKTYIEVWVEKDALSGVLSRVTQPYHIPILVNRGYSSASAMHDAYLRFDRALVNGAKKVKVLYLGDFDPSGLDMVRDVEQRICEFFLGRVNGFKKWVVPVGKYKDGREKTKSLIHFPTAWKAVCEDKLKIHFEIIPVALTREQIEEHQPPPNPAKRTDGRFKKFNDLHGDLSWEVDALQPEVLNQILTTTIENHIDRELYDSIIQKEKSGRSKLKGLRKHLSNSGEEEE